MGNWMLCKLSTGSTIELQRIALRWFRPRSHRSSPHTKTISQQWTSRSMRVACLDDLMICDDIWWTPLVGYVMQHGAVYWDIMKLYSSAKHCVISTHCSTLQKKRRKTATGNVTMIIQWLLQHVQNTALALQLRSSPLPRWTTHDQGQPLAGQVSCHQTRKEVNL